MNYLKNTLSIFKYNIRTLLNFEILFKLLLGLILMPIVVSGFHITMKLSGYSYLTIENIFKFAVHPFTILFIFFVILYLTIATLLDISTMVIIYDASYRKIKIKLKDAVKMSFRRCKNVVKLKNILIAFMLLFLLPLLNIVVGSNVISSIKIPEFIMDYITKNSTLSFIVITLYIVFGILLLRWIYAIHYMILEGQDFKEARRNSCNLAKRDKFKDAIKIVFTQIGIAIIYIILFFIGVLLIVLLHKYLKNLEIIESVLVTLIWVFILISLLLSTTVSNAFSYAIISSLFYIHKTQKNEQIFEVDYSNIDNKKRNIFRSIMFSLLALSIVGGSVLTYQIITGKANLNIENIRNMEITAHRGASVLYPENTMSAFIGAKNLGADWIELDVQQTKDRQIVVSHDTNLSRITGVNKDIIDLDYEEISKLDAGSFFSKEFKGEKMPLLEDVIIFAKENNIRVNIELKPVGKEVDFEKQVIELIKKYNFEEMCLIASQKYEVLENAKKIDSSIKTLYVMSIAIGKITDLEYADGFSVEATNVTSDLVNTVHSEGKELFAWTVNTKDSINKMIRMNVDNIITDNIELGKQLLLESKQSDVITEVLDAFSE